MSEKRSISEMQQKIVNDNLIDAVRNSDREKVELCLKKGADINARGSWSNRTALMYAVAYARPEQVEFLLMLARGFRTAAKFLFPIPEHGLEKRLRRITAPTLVLWGAEDRFAAPLYGRIFAEKIPNARLETIDRAGHLIGLERPEPYAEAVVRFGRAAR